MELKKMIGQMMMCGFDAHEPNNYIKDLIERYCLGNVIYFKRNLNTLGQLSHLSQTLHHYSTQFSEIPLNIAIDQEGGMVARIDKEPFPFIPGNMTLGAINSKFLAYEVAKKSAIALSELGIDINLAPCLDVNTNPNNPIIGVRSFGDDPQLVCDLGNAVINGYQDGGIYTCAKHFPGHGDTALDSHRDLPALNLTLDELLQRELIPFQEAILSKVDMILTAHIQFPYIDQNYPATLSKVFLTDILRNQMNFEGVIITDCLEMKAIEDYYGIEEGAVRSIEAGTDIVLVSHRYEKQIRAFHAIEQAVKDKRISLERIEESYQRIIKLKSRRKKLVVKNQIYEKAVTLVQDHHNYLPLRKEEKILVVWPEVDRETEVDEVSSSSFTLAEALNERMVRAEAHILPTEPNEAEIRICLDTAKYFETVIVVTYNAREKLHPGQIEIVEQLSKNQEKKIIVVASRNPYDLMNLPNISTYICCYEKSPKMMKALSKCLLGLHPFEGKLPVNIRLLCQ